MKIYPILTKVKPNLPPYFYGFSKLIKPDDEIWPIITGFQITLAVDKKWGSIITVLMAVLTNWLVNASFLATKSLLVLEIEILQSMKFLI